MGGKGTNNVTFGIFGTEIAILYITMNNLTNNPTLKNSDLKGEFFEGAGGMIPIPEKWKSSQYPCHAFLNSKIKLNNRGERCDAMCCLFFGPVLKHCVTPACH